MRRPNRNIEIFSMSVLDMFASALGAFILITIILFPNYNKKMKLEAELARERELTARQRAVISELQAKTQRLQEAVQVAEVRAARAEQQAREAREQVTALQTQVESLKQELFRTFLVVTASWDDYGEIDVDLHVTDPDGHEFYADNPTYYGSDGLFALDSTVGPGYELFQLPKAKPGTYKIELVYVSSDKESKIAVHSSVFSRQGRTRLPDTMMTPPPKTLVRVTSPPKVLVTNLVVRTDGSIDTGVAGVQQ